MNLYDKKREREKEKEKKKKYQVLFLVQGIPQRKFTISKILYKWQFNFYLN